MLSPLMIQARAVLPLQDLQGELLHTASVNEGRQMATQCSTSRQPRRENPRFSRRLGQGQLYRPCSLSEP